MKEMSNFNLKNKYVHEHKKCINYKEMNNNQTS